MSTPPPPPSGDTNKPAPAKMDASHVVVRLQQSKGLQDAFRVHVLPESLTDAGLKLNDICQITSEDGMTTGYGIAWRAEDKMGSRPKTRPAKMTETFRDLYDFKDGSKVKISRADTKLYPADRIVLYDVTPEGHNKPDVVDETNWEMRIGVLFEDADALAPGVSFEVTGVKKYRRRFHIEHIESAGAPDGSCLYRMRRGTSIELPNGTLSRLTSPVNGHGHGILSLHTNGFGGQMNGDTHLELDPHRLGGLVEQTRKLNEQMGQLLESARIANGHARSRAVLLHGYQGCGKTTVMEALAGSGFRKVYRIEPGSLLSGTLSKARTQIQETFQQAAERANQPSLILIDKLEKLTPNEEDKFSDTFIAELERIKDCRVMIAAATRSISELNASIIGPSGFWRHIEIPIPDAAARQQILNVARQKSPFAKDDISAAIAARTHGYTGADLQLLHGWACDGAEQRDKREAASRLRSPSLPTYDEANSFYHDSPAQSSTRAIERQSEPLDTQLEDYEKALPNVIPTALREIFTEKPKVQWSNIGGSDKVRESFDKILGLRQNDRALLEEFQRKPEKGVLLYGPPGCSKTMTAQAVANSYNFNFIAIKGAELISKYVGDSEKKVREVFAKARAAAPCVIFFDEIDAIATSRDLDSGSKGLNVLTTLLNEMDGFDELKDVLILAATNKPESLDPALIRPGRFDSHVYLGPPNLAARQDIFRIACSGVRLSEEVKFALLAGKTEGYSGAEIVKICEGAKDLAIGRVRSGEVEEGGMRCITMRDFDSAREDVRRGITEEMLRGYEMFAKR
ncbi:hypothetical protein CKM354_000898400 [Cercospora kikuchii]|uniref:AAA+ ATPase domain-containing protein n=1 Tax=Cercospora kikuchii TaxID=84275 RepID=A0A9P3CN62_9PEZI|nr:uncharacterized protein CKM354_000898400 [Cercospora kikuchii]GIZ45833.1 hypothetical protein CKM354_000898400 [Cercospora kikuchii]